jgi:outer membrane protein assembly factor BamB
MDCVRPAREIDIKAELPDESPAALSKKRRLRPRALIFRPSIVVSALLVVCFSSTRAADWPTYQHDNARSGTTPEELKLPLHEEWVFTSHRPQPAWPEPRKELSRVRYDEVYQVAVADGSVYFGSSADDKVYSLDAATGEIRWSVFTGGPIRLAPTVWQGRVLVGSDDGHVYCLSADAGSVLWKFKAPFSDRKVLGNGRMISLWPVRTGVLVEDGIAYFGAGIFPSEDIFICAVNASDGTPLWRNDTCGERGPEQEFGGISPQGYLLGSESRLYVPSGRAMPAVFNRSDGRYLYHCSAGGKVGGTWALLTEEHVVAGLGENVSYDKQTGKRMGSDRYAWFPGLRLIAAPDRSYLLGYREVSAIDRKTYPAAMNERKAVMDSRSKLASRIQDLRKKRDGMVGAAAQAVDKEITELTNEIKDLDKKQKEIEAGLLKWRVPFENPSSMILAGGVLFMGGNGTVVALEAATGKGLWSATVKGKAAGIAASGGHLFVSTDTGAIHCFGSSKPSSVREIKLPVAPDPYPEDGLAPLYADAAETIIKTTGVQRGYCLVLGCGIGHLAFELAKRTDLKVIGVEPDGDKVEVARRRLDAAGLYGSRITIHQESPSRLPYSDFFANLIVSDDLMFSGRLDGSPSEMFRVLRPCGGVAFFGQPANTSGTIPRLDVEELRRRLSQSGAREVEVVRDNGVWAKVLRGPLEGAGSWTHLYANPANTACSDDRFVKCPLGVLWFGDPGPEKMVERHARAAGPVSLDGRLFVQGENVVMAYDAYNGSILWQRQIPGAVRVRADADGSNLAVTKRGLFVAVGSECLRLDLATGETLQTYKVPSSPDGSPRRWGYLASVGNVLLGSTARPLTDYGAAWREMVQEDGTWRPLPKNISPEMRSFYTELVSRYPRPDERALADFDEMGAMWEPMARFPKWGEVRTSQGAVTPSMMTSNSIFALDADTGDLKWVYSAGRIAHPTITIGDGTIFFAESSISNEEREKALAEKTARVAKLAGEDADKLKQQLEYADVRLVVALDAASGTELWKKVLDLTGCGGDRMASAYRDGMLVFFGAFSNHDRGLFGSGTLKWRRVMALSAKDGMVLWSRELGYLRRPVVMQDKLIVEPWMCDIRTGELLTRIHPITGKEVPWEFIRGGHSCGITTACPNCFFLRSFSMTYYDLTRDDGMLPFGGIRPGCWINTIMANGLVLCPEASSGCRCSFPIVSTVALAPREPIEENRVWSLFPKKGEQTPGTDALTPVRHLALNFGAPGDRRDEDGTLWFCYPRPKLRDLQVEWVMQLPVKEEILPGRGYFGRNFRGVRIEGTDKPWLFASGCVGMTRCTAPLLEEGDKPASYTVRMYFAAPEGDQRGQRVFDVKLQGQTVLKDFDVVRSAGASQEALVREFRGVAVTRDVTVEFVPNVPEPTSEHAPVVNAVEFVRE